MSKYKGLFTYDIDNHKYIPVEQADGIISEMNYRQEPKGINEIDVVLDAIREYRSEHLCCSEDWEKIKILNIVEEKLKAWKRLKDGGFEFVELRAPNYGSSDIMTIKARCPWTSKNIDDLGICFGGEDEQE